MSSTDGARQDRRYWSNTARRGSLAMAESALGDLFGRRASGFSELDGLTFGRRGSLDSTSAVLDAAIMDLTRRRLSMAMGLPGDLDALGMGTPSSMENTNYSMGAPLSTGNLFQNGDSGNNMDNSSNQALPASSQISPGELSSEQLQQQQRDLEQRQRELEVQRQQLMAAMEERRSAMQKIQHKFGQSNTFNQSAALQRNSLLGSFGGSGGLGGNTQPGFMGLNFPGTMYGSNMNMNMGMGMGMIMGQRPSLGMGRRSSLGMGGNIGIARRNSLDLLMGSLDRPQMAALAQQGQHHHLGRRDSLGIVGLNEVLGDSPDRQAPIEPPQQKQCHGHGHADSAPPIPNTMSTGPFAQMERPLPLAMESDKDWLTPLHCFVRQHCVHVFTASDQDVATPSKGKRKPIQVGQVGIRCPHCHHDIQSSIKARERGSVYFPTCISSIYNATMNLLQRHLHTCTSVPAEIMRRYETLKADDARSGTSKKYWIESALSLGLVDTENGIRYSAKTPPPLLSAPRHQSMLSEQHRTTENETTIIHGQLMAATSKQDGLQHGSESSGGPTNDASVGMDGPLVRPEDEPYATAFSYNLLRQMQPCVFTEADRLGKRKGLPPGFPGLACRHCFGGYGSGRFFPSSIKTLSDTSKTLNVLHNHMLRCRKCPAEIRETLIATRKHHDEQRAKMKFGSQKAFFARIWDRLHYKDPNVTSKRKFKGSEAKDGAGNEQKLEQQISNTIPNAMGQVSDLQAFNEALVRQLQQQQQQYEANVKRQRLL